ncbi:ABC transporter permease [Paractinoplanes lichenicola]|uniref:ABC transporter permease n=1 Tax=Paractinoplanes lichenicola TaxID=2802976 RepID=A0ABS1VXQ9_9ACTN|nr:ABC transporter permease [Actinoplanes lichenicola]MBL7259281.1 ABC transporter permease [Actinoplanes lichenicola]
MSVLRTQLRGVARRPSRLLLTGLAVLVVSFVVYATVLAQQITERSVLNGLSGTPEAAAVVVQNGTVTSAELAQVQKIAGVEEAIGRVENGTQVGGEYLSLLGDPGTGPLAMATVSEGRYPSKPGEIAVTPRTVERMGIKTGSTVNAQIRYDEDGKPLAPSKLTVVGVVQVRDDYGFQAYAPTSAILKLGGYDFLNRIEVRLAPGADAATVIDKVNAVFAKSKIPSGERPQVQDGATVRLEEAEAVAEEVNTIFAVIAMFVAIAVVAAGLVATSTFRIVFAQRMRQLALLRAVGAGRGSIIRALAVEGALTGLATGLTGVVIALGAGHLLPVVAGWFGKNISSPGFPIPAALLTVLLAVFLTVVAVLAPAVSASRVSPLEALRGSGTTGARRDIGKVRWAAGIVLVLGAALTAGYIITNLPAPNDEDYRVQPMLFALVASGAFAFFALVTLGPVLVRPVLALIGWPLRRSSPVGRLAAGGVGAAPRRAAAVSVVVALGVTLIAGTLVGGASLRELADRELAASVPADYELLGVDEAPVPVALAEQLKQRDELADVTPYRRMPVKLGATEDLAVTDLKMSALPELGKLDLAAGSLADLGPGKIVLSGFGADNSGKKVGDQIQLSAGKRTVSLTVVAQFAGDAPLHASAVLDPADLTKLGAPATFSGVLANAKAGGETGRTNGNRAIQDAQVAAGGKWRVDVLADQRDQLNDNVTMLLIIAIGLVGLTVVIAVVGVGTTTALSVVERVRESGVLRAVGLSRGGLRTMLTTESALYGAIGAAVGLVLGVPYAWLAVKALGLNAPFSMPYGQLAIVFLVLVAMTALAGVLPARRAAKVSPVAALGSE